MTHDPERIAHSLFTELGPEDAYRKALSAAVSAQNVHDNYALSVWREVKYILAQRLTEMPEAA